jgi:ribosomal protein L37AE/L43A
METIDSNAIHMELKYCERCGGLWLRIKGSEVIYCPGCSMMLAGVARDPRGLEHRAARTYDSNGAPVENAFWGEGGQA